MKWTCMSRGINSTTGYAMYREWCKISVIPTFKLNFSSTSILPRQWEYIEARLTLLSLKDKND